VPDSSLMTTGPVEYPNRSLVDCRDDPLVRTCDECIVFDMAAISLGLKAPIRWLNPVDLHAWSRC
jgi:hypothetical protein